MYSKYRVRRNQGARLGRDSEARKRGRERASGANPGPRCARAGALTARSNSDLSKGRTSLRHTKPAIFTPRDFASRLRFRVPRGAAISVASPPEVLGDDNRSSQTRDVDGRGHSRSIKSAPSDICRLRLPQGASILWLDLNGSCPGPEVTRQRLGDRNLAYLSSLMAPFRLDSPLCSPAPRLGASHQLSGQAQTLEIKQLVGPKRLAPCDMPQSFEQFAHQRHDAFRTNSSVPLDFPMMPRPKLLARLEHP